MGADKATPRPWAVSASRWDVMGTGDIHIARMSGGLPTGEAQANVALIVRAVNAHDALVAALTWALDRAELDHADCVIASDSECDALENDGDASDHAAIRRARHALALALARGEG
jgi:hypothetical protein